VKRILHLGPERPALTEFLESRGDQVERTGGPIAANDPLVVEADIIVSYGYSHIVRADVLDLFQERAVNLHISLLPWNRGADPNLWSFLEDTPKGVTVHVMDVGVDTGPIYAQERVEMFNDDTLRTSYARLSEAMLQVFFGAWDGIRSGSLKPRPQVGDGTLHRLVDKVPYEHLLAQGWDTPVSSLRGRAKENEES
jgi:methionyl-tRNA formyltransferase